MALIITISQKRDMSPVCPALAGRLIARMNGMARRNVRPEETM